jgi:hypothetical protein
VQTIWQAQYSVPPLQNEMKFPHSLQTADVVPAFTPSWNAVIYPIEITDTYIRARSSVPVPARAATVDYSVSRGTSVAVPAGQQTATVTHNFNDASAVILFAANWNTTIKINSKAANSTVVGFSVVAPANARLYFSQHADTSDITSTETVASGAQTHTFHHGAGRGYLPIFATPYWNTTIIWTTKADLDETVLKFSAAPSGTASLDTRVKAVGNLVTS